MKLKDLASRLDVHVIGNAETEVTGIASLRSAGPADLVFIEEEENLQLALQSKAAAIIVGKFRNIPSQSKPLLVSTQPRLAFARAASILFRNARPAVGIHESAVVHSSAQLGNNVHVAERAVIADSVELGESTSIGAGCVIGSDVMIGKNCQLYPNVTIYPGVRLGDRVIVHAGAVLGSDGFGYVRDKASGHYEKFPQVGRLEIEDDVEIGANSTMDRGALDVTRIRRGTKIDNLVHVGHNVQIGEDVVIAAQTGLSGSAVVEKDVIIGGQVGIADHVRIEEGAILGAQSGIPTKKVIRGKGIVFWGTPARPIRDYLKELAVLARLARTKKS